MQNLIGKGQVVTRSIWLVLCIVLFTPEQAQASPQQYTIIDQTSMLPVTTITLPSGWQIVELYRQDNQNPFNLFHFYQRDYFGPGGEVVTYLFPFSVYPFLNENSDEIWAGKFHAKLAGLGSFDLGPSYVSDKRSDLLPVDIPDSILFLERRFTGKLVDGQRVEGRTFSMAVTGPFNSIYAAYIVMSPAGQWQSTFNTFADILRSGIEHPEFLQHAQQVGLRKMRAMQSQIANRQRAHNEHMKSMRQLNEYQSIANKDFSTRMLQRSSSLTESVYGSTEAFNDYMKGTTSFNDPYTGYQISQQGHFERWYTDNYGNFIGTNDPDFNASSMNGFWQKIEPLGN